MLRKVHLQNSWYAREDGRGGGRRVEGRVGGNGGEGEGGVWGNCGEGYGGMRRRECEG